VITELYVAQIKWTIVNEDLNDIVSLSERVVASELSVIMDINFSYNSR